MDATVESELGTRFGVTGYPTMKVFRKGTPTDYKGPRDAAGIVSYMQKQAAPAITILKSLADLEKFVQDEAAIVYFGEASGKVCFCSFPPPFFFHSLTTRQTYKTFESLTDKQRETFRFGQTSAADILAKYGHKDEVVLVQSKRYTQSPLEVATLAHKEGDLLSFIQKNFLPLVGELTNDNQNLYNNKDVPLVKIYHDLNWQLNSKGANYLLNKIRKVWLSFLTHFKCGINPALGC